MMQITPEQFQLLAPCLPKQRGNVSLPNLQMLNAILYVAEQGCEWRALPAHYGNWHTIYTRMNRWAKQGVLDRVFEQMQLLRIARINIEAVSLDSTSIKVHPDGTGALKKRSPSHRAISRRTHHQNSFGCRGCSNGSDFLPVAGTGRRRSERTQIASGVGRQAAGGHPAIADGSAYEGDEMRRVVSSMGMEPVVPPKKNQRFPWEYDRKAYKRRNEVERLFRRLKGFGRIFSRFEKLDVMFAGFISFVLAVDMLR